MLDLWCVISFAHVGHVVLFIAFEYILLTLILKYLWLFHKSTYIHYKYVLLCTILTILWSAKILGIMISQLNRTCLVKNNPKQMQWLTSPVALIIMTWLAMVWISVMLASWSTVTYKNVHMQHIYITQHYLFMQLKNLFYTNFLLPHPMYVWCLTIAC